jgi:hypothetical protein
MIQVSSDVSLILNKSSVVFLMLLEPYRTNIVHHSQIAFRKLLLSP